MKSIVLAFFAGSLSGLVSVLCGVGGGIVMVPVFVSAFQLSQKQAIATSLAVILPTVLIATMRNASGPGNFVQWNLVIPAALGAVLTAYLGVDLMRSLSNEVLTRIFALVLIVIGVRMLFW